jgi:hypothetical protein
MSFDPSTRYRDRIESSSRHYNNPYRQDLWSMNSYKAAVERGRDQLETHNQRVERQLIEKFQKNNFKAISGGFTAFVHIGKSIILILVAPPYFLLFIMPKWAFQNLMPVAEKVNELIEGAWMRVSAWTVDIFGIFTTKIGELRAKMKRQKKESKPKQEKELDPRLIQLKQKLKEILKSIPRAQEKISQAIADLRIRLFAWINTKKNEFVKQVKSIVQYGKQKFNERIEQLQARLINWMKPKLEKIARGFAAIDRGLEKVVHALSVPLKKVYKAVSTVVQPVIPAVKATAQFLQMVMAPPLQFLFKHTSKASELAKSVIVQSASAVQKGVTAAVQSFVVISQTAFRPFAVAAAWTSQEAMRGVQHMAKRIRNVSTILAIVMKRAVLSCLEKGKEQAKKFLQWAGKKAKSAGVAVISALLTLKYLPGYLWKIAKFLLGIFYRLWRKFSHSFKVLYVLTKHLVRQSLVQLERSLHKTQ